MFPFYLSIGMTAEEYWDGAWWLTAAYYEAHILSEKRKNRDMWLQGKYFHDGMEIVLANAFAKKGAPKIEYPKKPYRIFKPTAEEIAEEQAEQEAEMQAALEAMVREQKRKKANLN